MKNIENAADHIIEANLITSDDLQREYDFITVTRFMNSMLAQGKITDGEFHKIMQKVRDKFSPLYPEIRA